ncbi:MAG TPA: hypothetical protein VIV11_36700 [Kofleriaceae bacterium]
MTRQDALEIRTIEIVATIRDACAPVTHYTCRCKTCDTQWSAIEVYDEMNERPSEWSWTRLP